MQLKQLLIHSLTLLLTACGQFAMAARPNVILILCDDLGYGDVQCLNPQGKIATPNMDRLAAEGVTFTDAHSSSAVCTPTRYSLLTGRYNWRTRLQSGVLGGISPRLIEPDVKTLADVMQQQGYQTACVGKWHLGLDWQAKAEASFEDVIEKGAEGWGVGWLRVLLRHKRIPGYGAVHLFGERPRGGGSHA
jgi:arylsulfatase A-like enzyme